MKNSHQQVSGMDHICQGWCLGTNLEFSLKWFPMKGAFTKWEDKIDNKIRAIGGWWIFSIVLHPSPMKNESIHMTKNWMLAYRSPFSSFNPSIKAPFLGNQFKSHMPLMWKSFIILVSLRIEWFIHIITLTYGIPSPIALTSANCDIIHLYEPSNIITVLSIPFSPPAR